MIDTYDIDVTHLIDMRDVDYTMCSSQLLHLDMDNRPLRVNGWIQEDKFRNDARGPINKFELFTSERREDRDIVHWDIGAYSMCYLETD